MENSSDFIFRHYEKVAGMDYFKLHSAIHSSLNEKGAVLIMSGAKPNRYGLKANYLDDDAVEEKFDIFYLQGSVFSLNIIPSLSMQLEVFSDSKASATKHINDLVSPITNPAKAL